MSLEKNLLFRAWKHGTVYLKDDLYAKYLSGWRPAFASIVTTALQKITFSLLNILNAGNTLTNHGVNLLCQSCPTRFSNEATRKMVVLLVPLSLRTLLPFWQKTLVSAMNKPPLVLIETLFTRLS